MAKWIMDVVVNYMYFKLSYTCLRNIVLALQEVESKADVAFFQLPNLTFQMRKSYFQTKYSLSNAIKTSAKTSSIPIVS